MSSDHYSDDGFVQPEPGHLRPFSFDSDEPEEDEPDTDSNNYDSLLTMGKRKGKKKPVLMLDPGELETAAQQMELAAAQEMGETERTAVHTGLEALSVAGPESEASESERDYEEEDWDEEDSEEYAEDYSEDDWEPGTLENLVGTHAAVQALDPAEDFEPVAPLELNEDAAPDQDHTPVENHEPSEPAEDTTSAEPFAIDALDEEDDDSPIYSAYEYDRGSAAQPDHRAECEPPLANDADNYEPAAPVTPVEAFEDDVVLPDAALPLTLGIPTVVNDVSVTGEADYVEAHAEQSEPMPELAFTCSKPDFSVRRHGLRARIVATSKPRTTFSDRVMAVLRWLYRKVMQFL